MKPEDFLLSWFDYFAVVVLLLGIFYSRQHPLGEELFHACKWLLVVVVCSYTYQPAGQMIHRFTGLNLFLSSVGGYLISLLWIIIAFSYLKQWLGERLIAVNFFGSAEHYFVMATGAARFGCILLVSMALLNAKQVGCAEIHSEIKMQIDNFGKVSLPTIGLLQQDIFEESLTGIFIKTHFPAQLIAPVPSLKAKDTIKKDRRGPFLGKQVIHPIELTPVI